MLKENYDIFVKFREKARMGKYREAYNGYKELLEKEPDDIFLVLELGRVEVKLRLYNDAKKHFEFLLDTRSSRLANFELGKLNVTLRNYGEARHYFQTLIDLADDYYAAFELAKLESLCQNYELAERMYINLLKKADDKAVRLELGILERKFGKFEEARKNFLNLALNGDPYGMLELGKLEGACGNSKEAKRWFYTLYNLEPGDKSNFKKKFNIRKNKLFALFEIARIEANDDNLWEARKIFQKLIDEFDDDFSKIELARIESILGDVDEARKILKDLYKEKSDIYALVELGKLENDLGNLKDSRKYLELVLQKEKNMPALLELARLEVKEGNANEATKYFESVFGTNNESYALLELIDLYISLGQYKQALVYLEKLVYKHRINSDLIKKYEFFLKHKLGILEGEYPDTYFYNQITSYSEERLIEHLETFMDEEDRIVKNIQFVDNLDVRKLLDDVYEKLKNSNKYMSGLVDNYVIDLGYVVGICYDFFTSKVRVKTISNTSDIIMLVPLLSPYINKFYGRKRTKKIINS